MKEYEGYPIEEFVKTQDKQFKKCQEAEVKYKSNNDINVYIAFWENLWQTEGLLFAGWRWTFRLTNLYIDIEDYDKALKSLDYVRNCRFRDYYTDHVVSYTNKIQKLQRKKTKSAPL